MKEIFALRCHIFIVFLSKLLGEAGRRIAGPPSLAHQPLGGGLTPPPPLTNCGGPPGLHQAGAEATPSIMCSPLKACHY